MSDAIVYSTSRSVPCSVCGQTKEQAASFMLQSRAERRLTGEQLPRAATCPCCRYPVPLQIVHAVGDEHFDFRVKCHLEGPDGLANFQSDQHWRRLREVFDGRSHDWERVLPVVSITSVRNVRRSGRPRHHGHHRTVFSPCVTV